jgi:2-C-methyl-D-erythritol 4-phosphate cytidylyltransferase
MKISLILLAGGKGKRFGQKKQFLEINRKPVYQYSVDTANKIEEIEEIIFVLPEEDKDFIKIKTDKPVKFAEAGKERQFSVYNGLQKTDADIVIIHDTARPFATEKMFRESIENVKKGFDGSITAYKSRDTIKKVKDKKVINTLNREELFIIQTPQTFVYSKILKAHNYAIENNITGTDDSYLMEILGYNITVNEGSQLNLKLTYKEDLILANCIVESFK